MLDSEVNKGVLTFFVNFVIGATAEPAENIKEAKVKPSRLFSFFILHSQMTTFPACASECVFIDEMMLQGHKSVHNGQY